MKVVAGGGECVWVCVCGGVAISEKVWRVRRVCVCVCGGGGAGGRGWGRARTERWHRSAAIKYLTKVDLCISALVISRELLSKSFKNHSKIVSVKKFINHRLKIPEQAAICPESFQCCAEKNTSGLLG